MASIEVEEMSLDDYIQAKKEPVASSPETAVSVRSGFSLGRGTRRPVGRPVKPLEYDWTWTSGEEIKEREVSLAPRTFFRGRGGWKVRGNRGRGFPYSFARGRGGGVYQRFNFVQRRPFFRRGRGSRGFTTFRGRGRGRGFYSGFNLEGKLPVHQRLGWLTPARRYALQSLKTARRNLNRPPPFNPQQQRFLNQGNRNMARFQLLRQYRNMHEDTDDDTCSMITVSVNNELASMRRGRGTWSMRARGMRGGRGYAGAGFRSQLSRQNVARLPGHAASISASNVSVSRYSGRSSNHRGFKQNNNRRLFDERQLPSSRHTASLQSVQRRIRPTVDGFLVPAAPPKIHAVQLDKKLQSEILSIQSQGSTVTLSLEYKPLSTNTTTSTSDRFSLMA